MLKNRIGIIGAGVMGRGVAYQLSKFNYEVVLVDVSDAILEQAKEDITNTQRLDILMQKRGKSPVTPHSKKIMDNISFSTVLELVAGAEIIVENVTEKLEVKLEVYDALKTIIEDDTLVAVNTSATSITRIASRLNVPQRVLGIHFVNPVHLMPTVEMIQGLNTSQDSIERANNFLASLQMKGVLVNDSPGFVSNRVMLTYINEAIFCVQEQVGSAQAVDQIFRECLSHKMGPLQTADLIGLDTVLFSLEMLYTQLNDSKYRPAYLLRKMVDGHLLGQKTGEGFYRY
jgi:3-hydroxybutyryl-CoA dehydrogenase